MKVASEKVETGCLLIKDVMGRTHRPIIPKNTTLTPVHIDVLKSFQIEYVEVATRKADGRPFTAGEAGEKKGSAASSFSGRQTKAVLSFQDEYREAVEACREWFRAWQGGSPVDMGAVRSVMVPLLERTASASKEVFHLHHLSTSEDYIYHHSIATGVMAGYLASKLGFNYGEWIQVGLAGVLCDAGMAKIDQRILHKQGALTEREYEQVKNHPTYSYRAIERIPSLSSQAKLAVLQHHERLDGTGYPLGLTKKKIHTFSQIIAVCDMFHAMTSERIYRSKQSLYKVLEELLHEHFGRYDHKVIETLKKEIANFSTGVKVRLSDKQEAEVLFAEMSHPTRPMIKLLETGDIIQLKEYLQLHIEEVYD